MTKSAKRDCQHDLITSSPSPHAERAGYKPFTTQQVYSAVTGTQAKVSAKDACIINSFPAPLVLPGDDLANDPKYPPQSVRSCEQVRNEVTTGRNVVYVAAAPKIVAGVKFMTRWLKPGSAAAFTPIKSPPVGDIVAYLQAFYHGLVVRELPEGLSFRPWSDDSEEDTPQPKDSDVRYVGLETDGAMTRIKVRNLRLSTTHGYLPVSAYTHQLNLNDILDHAISVLPSDAYALLLMVDHDVYENDEDDFCCGRAYGGSRVAVVSSAQYNPCLDLYHKVAEDKDSLAHVWPAGHCKDFVDQMCQTESTAERSEGESKTLKAGKAASEHIGGKRKRSNSQAAAVNSKLSTKLPTRHKPLSFPSTAGLTSSNPILIDSSPISQAESRQSKNDVYTKPIEAAVQIHKSLSCQSSALLASTYALRVARTASHELGHCFGMDHCVYLACAMQGTCSVAEDARQPPYLCYVCERKVGRAVINYQLSQRGNNAEHSKKGRVSKSNQRGQVKDYPESDLRIQRWTIDRHRAMIAFCQTLGGSTNTSKREAFQPLEAWSHGMLDVLENMDPQLDESCN